MKKVIVSIIMVACTAICQAQVTKTEKGVTFIVDEDLPMKELSLRPMSGRKRADALLSEAKDFSDKEQNAFSPNGNSEFKYKYVTSSFREDSIFHLGQDEAYTTFTYAFANHCSLVLSPDIIWMLICQGFAAHVDAYHEELRQSIVSHEGKKELEIESEKDLLAEDADWQAVISGFTQEMDRYVKEDLVNTITADFSTTSLTARIASQMTLMGALREFFTYKDIYVSCGIPSITLEGTPDDWRNVLEKTMKLKKYKLGWWVSELKPILQEFITASEGHPNQAFWKDIVMKDRPDRLRSSSTGCGGINKATPTPYDGWFLKLFPYCEKGVRTPNQVDISNNMMRDITKVDLKYTILYPDLTSTEYQMILMAGFVGVEVDEETHTLKPKIGWLAGVERSKEELAEEEAKKEARRVEIRKIREEERKKKEQEEYEKANLLLYDEPKEKSGNAGTTFSDGYFKYRVIDEDMVSISSIYADSTIVTHPRYSGTLVIPGTVEHEGKTYKVAKISKEGFEACDMDSVIISEGVDSIGEYAFSACMHLKSISIPASVYDIEVPISCICDELSSITVDRENKVYDSRNNCNGVIETECNKLTCGIATTKIPRSVTDIGEWAFNSCTALREMIIPEGVKEVCDFAFSGCTNLKSLHLPSTLEEFSSEAMGGTNNLESIAVSPKNKYYDSRNDCNAIIEKDKGNRPNTLYVVGRPTTNCLILGCATTKIPSDINCIGMNAFMGCNIREITIPNNVTEIMNHAFWNCHQLESVTLPDSLEELGYFAFHGCTSLKSITIPNSVTSIEDGLFYGCTGLTSINIPNSVTSINADAFNGCTSLSYIKVDDANEVYDSRNDCNAIIESKDNCLIIGCRNSVIPESVRKIEDYAFRNRGITEINIPASVDTICETAFIENTDLQKITVDKDNRRYDSRNGCNAIIETATNNMLLGCRTTVFPEGVTEITHFVNTPEMLILPEGITKIEELTFSGCESLRTIVLPKSLSYLSNGAFRNCPNLEYILSKSGSKTMLNLPKH